MIDYKKMAEDPSVRAAKSEREYRRNLIGYARQIGIEGDIIQILDKYDRLLHRCTNKEEYKHIAATGIMEVNAALNFREQALAINGIVITPANPGV